MAVLPSLGSRAQAAVLAPSGLTPAFGAQVPGTPVLGWARVSGATRYDVEISSQPSFTPTLFSKSTTNQQIVPTSVLPAGPVYWRVRAVDASGAGAWASSQVAVSTTLPPVLLGPANTTDDLLEQPGEPPLLSWRPVPGAAAYQIEVDTETDFIGASSYSTKSTSFVVPDPKADGQYFWRVRAQLSNGLYTDFSAPWTYKIGPLSQVTQRAPVADTKVTDVVLEWDPVKGAKTYELQVSSDQDFNTIIDSKVNIKSTRYSPATTYLNDQYYWRVRALNNQGETFEWVNVEGKKMFQRHWPTPPRLEYPASALSPVVGDDLYFQWTPVDHATRYQLDIGTDGNFSPTTFNTCYTAGTTFTPGAFRPWGFDPCMPSQGGVYYWRVRGLDEPSNTQGIYSEIRRFIYDSGQVTQTAPAADATVDVPVLEWGAARDAEQYRVLLKDSTGKVVADTKTYSLAWTPTSTALDATKSPFTWTVQAVDGDGKLSPQDGGRRFWLSGMSPAATDQSLAPIGEATTTSRFPVLRWQP
ncbi:MAG: hypothetical protein ACTHJJ_15505, partial [Intrasporangium sp.]|uniref:hypothetical protein n=1 Tax=Intrasporangium sp. TaxID=1925024 RepID=UPI003F814CA2